MCALFVWGSGLDLKIKISALEQVLGPHGIKCVARVENQNYNNKMIEIMVGNMVPRKAKTRKGGEIAKLDPGR